MFRHHLQYVEIFLKCVKSAHMNEISVQYFQKYWIFIYLQKYFKNISEIVMLQWNILE